MSGEENRISRWAKRKGEAREGTPEKESSGKRGGARPVADDLTDGLTEKGFVKPMAPLAQPEEGELPYEAAPADALKLLEVEPSDDGAGRAALEAFPLRPEDEGAADDESRELTAEEEEVVKDLPPIKDLKKDSDFTPFFAQGVPDFLKRQAYKALWMSSPFFGFRDGLDDYDENFRLIDKLITAADSDYIPGKGYKFDDKKPDGGEDETVGDGEKEVALGKPNDPENKADHQEKGEEEKEEEKEGEEKNEEKKEGVEGGDDKKRKASRPSDVRPPDSAV